MGCQRLQDRHDVLFPRGWGCQKPSEPPERSKGNAWHPNNAALFKREIGRKSALPGASGAGKTPPKVL
jgi:hypothetical protein